MKIAVLPRFFQLTFLLAMLMATNPLIQAGTLPTPRGEVSNGLSLWYRAETGGMRPPCLTMKESLSIPPCCS